MARSPSFQFHVADFRQDPKTIVMTTAEIGAYMLLIMECWDKDNTLLNDIHYLADVARMPLARFQKAWVNRLERCFQFDPKADVYSHKRLAKEIRKQNTWSKIKSDAGKLGAAKRWKGNNLNGSAMAVPSSAMADDSSTSKEEEFKHTHNDADAWAWPMKPLIEAFPHLIVTSSMIGFIEDAVHPGDESAWAETIRVYKQNYNPALNSYMPEKTGNLLSVFKKHRAEIERAKNGSSKNGGGKSPTRRTDQDVIDTSVDWYENDYPA